MQNTTNPPRVPGRILVENVRASFVEGLWTASAPAGTNGVPAYNVQAIIPRDHPQVPELIRLINEAAVKQWKDKAQQVLGVAQAAGKVFLRDGNAKPYAGYAGNLYISARSGPNDPPPKVYEGRREVQRNESRIYSGCYINLLIDVFPYTKGSNGVGARLKGVQFLRDGEPLGGGAPAQAEDFADVAESAQAANEFGALFGTAAPAGSAGFDPTAAAPALKF